MSNPVPRLRRLLSIIPLIQRRQGISFQELQDALGVSKRELQADLNAIMLCGVPPYLPNDYISVFIDGDQVTVDYAEHFARPTRLTVREALALRLAIERLQLDEGHPLYDIAIDLLDQLDRVMRRAGQGSMASLEGRIESARPQAAGDMIRTIDDAQRRRVPLELTYYSASSESVRTRRVRPYGRGDRFGNNYLIGWCEERSAVLSFRLDRISRLTPLADAARYEIPVEFDLDAHLAALGGVGKHARIRFHRDIARFAAEDHAEMRVEHTDRGDAVVEMVCGSIPWAVSKTLLYGELAEVLEPPEARAEVVGRLEAWLGERRADAPQPTPQPA